jgi:glucosamine--fructose-6-phosphate aminotransferase (isomerizing)
MCGIVGYVGFDQSTPFLVQGLERLEYRGYDSSGLAGISNGSVDFRRSVGRVQTLKDKLASHPLTSTIGIAHTRWATHGRPTEENAHPHVDASGRLALVHNGVIENHDSLRHFLKQQGFTFRSETDSEVLVQLISFFYDKTHDLLESVRSALREVQGSFGIALLCSDEPDTLIAARRGSPLLVGKSDNAFFLASDASPFLDRTSLVTYLDDDEIVCLRPTAMDTTNLASQQVEKIFNTLELKLHDIDLQHHQHHMHKEIHEQPEALRNVLRGRINTNRGTVTLGGLTGLERELALSKKCLIFGCGTAWHAGLVGEYLFENLAGLPTEVDYASELRYRNPIVEEGTIAVAVSQSGETADTLAALQEVHSKGALSLGVVNTVGSSIARETDAGVFLHVGPEIGVASTKAFMAQVSVLTLMAMSVGRRKRLSDWSISQIIEEMERLPEKMETILQLEEHCKSIANQYVEKNNWLYLGRGINYPVALEGALKLKEVSYIHAEGLPAAEMKHGPIALIEEGTPVVVIATKDPTYDKVLANIEEVKSRGGKIIAVANEGDEVIQELADSVIEIPQTMAVLSPILNTIPLQLIAYHAALLKGLDVDKPRNLAKSVTVE